MARSRTSKKLSQRIDREYFKRLYAIPRWRRILSLLFTVAGLLWVFGSAVNSGAVFNAGPLSKGHHILSSNCASCHTGNALWGRKVEEAACVTCHDGPIHKEQQTFAPACLTCHVEHKGVLQLASNVNDISCTQCHANLQTKSGTTKVAAKVTAFDSSHPEFAIRREGATDPGTIKFGHEVHLKAGLLSPKGPTQLKCANCHTLQPNGQMATADFKDHCQSCHTLEFNRHINKQLPHDRPEIALAFARQALTEYVAQHPDVVNQVEPALDPKIMTARIGPAGTPAEWIRRGMEDTETLMWRKSCSECHTPNMLPGGDRQIPKAQITAVWMTGATFSHMGHQTVGCAECHGSAKTSKLTSDILMPGIATCQQCHRTTNPSASANCTECHKYHDWSKAKPIDTERTIHELLSR